MRCSIPIGKRAPVKYILELPPLPIKYNIPGGSRLRSTTTSYCTALVRQRKAVTNRARDDTQGNGGPRQYKHTRPLIHPSRDMTRNGGDSLRAETYMRVADYLHQLEACSARTVTGCQVKYRGTLVYTVNISANEILRHEYARFAFAFCHPKGRPRKRPSRSARLKTPTCYLELERLGALQRAAFTAISV